MRKILIATSNPGKLRDFAGAAQRHGVEIGGIPGFSSLPSVVEDGLTFEANARKKAEAYSQHVPGELVVADDSGLEIDALNGSPGVHSARYAAPDLENKQPHEASANMDDKANNARVLRELKDIPPDRRNVFQFPQDAGVVGLVIHVRAGFVRLLILQIGRSESSGMYAWRAVQRVDLQSRIVCDHKLSWNMLAVSLGFLAGVRFKCQTVLDDTGKGREARNSADLDSMPLSCPGEVSQLARVRSCNKDFPHSELTESFRWARAMNSFAAQLL